MLHCSPVKGYLALLPSLLFLTLCTCARAQFPPDVKAKLGEIHYSPAVGGVLGSEEPAFELLFEEERIESIRVGITANPDFRVVQVIEFTVRRADGSLVKRLIGGAEEADWQPVIAMPKGATLRGISGRGGWFIDAIRFHFTDGSQSPEYGGAGGDTEFRLLLAETAERRARGAFRGFYGTAGGLVESLGLVFWPLE